MDKKKKILLAVVILFFIAVVVYKSNFFSQPLMQLDEDIIKLKTGTIISVDNQVSPTPYVAPTNPPGVNPPTTIEHASPSPQPSFSDLNIPV